jgi:ribosomal protein S18 acetylase RimI-like enzyme
MRGLQIRRMRPGELEATVDLWERSRWDSQPWLEARMSHSHADNLHYFRDIVARGSEVWLAIEGDEVAGLLTLGNGHIDQLYVDPARQGRGVGTALLDKAKQLTPAGLTLFTHQRNARARAFYERRGFRAVAFGVSPAPENEPDVKYAWDPRARRAPAA